jgi:hypothetical protein
VYFPLVGIMRRQRANLLKEHDISDPLWRIDYFTIDSLVVDVIDVGQRNGESASRILIGTVAATER